VDREKEMKDLETSGRTVDEAVERALGELGLTRDDVDIEVVDPGARGLLGLGAHDARVRVRPRVMPSIAAHQLAEDLLEAMGFRATVRVRDQEGAVGVEVSGQNLAALIGRHGTTLEAMGVLLEAMVAKRTGHRPRIVVDVAGYRERRRTALEGIAKRAADRAIREGREIALDPMASYERRLIHTLLAEHPQVVTFSRGEGSERHIVIAPKDQAINQSE
jgi:spoIIIJ-associated protein